MNCRFVALWTVVMAGVIGVVMAEFEYLNHGWYRIGQLYAAREVSFALECANSGFSVEDRVIFDRARAGTNQVCVHRQGSLINLQPEGVMVERKGWDGSYRVALLFRENEARLIRKLVGSGNRSALTYRGDTVLTRFVGGGRDGEGIEISSYHQNRIEADIAMSQVAIPGGEEPTHSWHR